MAPGDLADYLYEHTFEQLRPKKGVLQLQKEVNKSAIKRFIKQQGKVPLTDLSAEEQKIFRELERKAKRTTKHLKTYKEVFKVKKRYHQQEIQRENDKQSRERVLGRPEEQDFNYMQAFRAFDEQLEEDV